MRPGRQFPDAPSAIPKPCRNTSPGHGTIPEARTPSDARHPQIREFPYLPSLIQSPGRPCRLRNTRRTAPEPGGAPLSGHSGRSRGYLLMISISPFSPASGISSPELSEEALSPAPAPLPESAGTELIPSVLSPRSSTGTLSPP